MSLATTQQQKSNGRYSRTAWAKVIKRKRQRKIHSQQVRERKRQRFIQCHLAAISGQELRMRNMDNIVFVSAQFADFAWQRDAVARAAHS